MPRISKSDEFSEKFQTAFDPPLIFGKLYCGFRDKIVTKVRMFIWRDCCVLYDPISHEVHVVQQFNMVIGWKHTLKRHICIIFMLKKPCLKVQILQCKSLDWKCPPPLRNFSENSFGNAGHPLGSHNFWQLLSSFAIFWQLLPSFGNLCHVLAIFDIFW